MVVETDAIQSELERIISSREFTSSPRLVRFLRYCVEQSEAGRIDSLKESVVGVNVFDRSPGYDPKLDPIVRVHARRLREKLESFYRSEGSPDLIIQVPKGGYVAHFGPPVEKARQPAAIAASPPSVTHLSRPLLMVAALALVVFILGWQLRRVTFAEPTVQPLVSLPGATNDPAWSPDGKTLAFTWDGGASQTSLVYLLRKGETVPARLTDGTRPEYRPRWSPDGKQVAFARETDATRFALVLVDLLTRSERTIRTVELHSTTSLAPALDWSPDGQWLVTSERPAEESAPVHLLLVSLTGGGSSVITDPPNGSTGDLEARFSPDSKHIVFRRGGHGELLALTLNGTSAAPPLQLTFQNGGVRGLSVSRTGAIYFGSQRENGEFGIWKIQEGDKTPTRVTPADVAAIEPAVDPDGHSVAFVQPAVDLNLWQYDARSSIQPRLLVPSTHAEYSPEFSPDGRNIAFVSDRSGTAQVWVSDLNGGQPQKITSLRRGDLPMSPAWSQDGTRLVYFCRRDGLNYAFETAVRTGVTRPLKEGPDYALFPGYSGDGDDLYYVSNAGNRFRIWRQRLAGREPPEPVIADEVRFFRISKDRRSLYFLRANRSLIRMNLATREKTTLLDLPDSPAALDSWDVSGTSLFYLSLEHTNAPSQLRVVDLTTGATRSLAPIRRLSRDWHTSISASPDGHSVLVTQVDSDDTKLMLLHLPAK